MTDFGELLSPLPGRVAVLVAERRKGSALSIPDAIRRRAEALGRTPYELRRGVVVAVGQGRGRVPLPPVGARVWVLPKAGLIIEPGDLDLPSLGSLIPEGWTLRLYGVGEAWHEQIAGTCLDLSLITHPRRG